MTGYLLHDGRASYLERTPYDNSYSWLAGTPTYATVFTQEAAHAMAAHLRRHGEHVDVMPDVCRPARVPEIGIEEIRSLVEPDGREPDGEDFRGGEAGAYERESQIDIARSLK